MPGLLSPSVPLLMGVSSGISGRRSHNPLFLRAGAFRVFTFLMVVECSLSSVYREPPSDTMAKDWSRKVPIGSCVVVLESQGQWVVNFTLAHLALTLCQASRLKCYPPINT